MEEDAEQSPAAAYIVATSAAPSMCALLQGTGWRSPGEIEVLDAGSARSSAEPANKILVEDRIRPEEMAEVVAGSPLDGRIRHRRDEDFFRWRFSNPLSRYWFLYASDRRMEGYLILQKWRSADPGKIPYNVVDWAAFTDEVLRDLIRAALRLANRQCLLWAAGLTARLRELALASGFRKRAERPIPLLRPLGPALHERRWMQAGRDLLDLRNWNLRMIDSDWY
jgi:hypothetical protein